MGFEKRSAYSEKLRDPRWQKMRLEVMQRDEFSCQFCFDNESTLNVHHRWYVRGRDPWEYPLDCLVTLCESCHGVETELLRESESYFIHVLKTAGATAAAFDDLVDPFHVPHLGLANNSDIWSVLAYGIREILRREPEQWDALRNRYYVWLRERKAFDARCDDVPASKKTE